MHQIRVVLGSIEDNQDVLGVLVGENLNKAVLRRWPVKLGREFVQGFRYSAIFVGCKDEGVMRGSRAL